MAVSEIVQASVNVCFVSPEQNTPPRTVTFAELVTEGNESLLFTGKLNSDYYDDLFLIEERDQMFLTKFVFIAALCRKHFF
jgi:hypothetical protein